MDRSRDWWQAVEASCRSLDVPETTLSQLKSHALLRNKLKPPPFMQAAMALLQSIQELRSFIRVHQDGYLSKGSYSDLDKDQIEVEVGAMVKECTQRIEQLKDSVLQAQAAASARYHSSMQAPNDSSQAPAAWVNEQTAAHRHGVVLSLAEQLHSVSAHFDKCRSQRYQQLSDSALKPQMRIADTPKQPAGGVWGTSSSLAGSKGGGMGSTSSLLNANGNQAVVKAAQLGGVVFSHVKGVTQTVLGAAAQHLAPRPASDDEEEDQVAGAGQPQQWTQKQAAQVQTQKQLAVENQDLVAQLQTTALAVHSVERTVREIATLNQLFSAAVLQQAEAIETIYTNAVEASMNIKRGNKEIQKTVEVNRSTQLYIFVLLLVATLGLLFFDWFNS